MIAQGRLATVTIAVAMTLVGNRSFAQDASDVASAEKLSTLGEMVDAPPSEVASRLEAEPALREMSERALSARSSRKSTGTTLAILGFTIFGVGDVVGTVLIVTTPNYPNVRGDDWNRVLGGLAVSVVSMGVGLGLGIPGVVKLSRASSEERRLVDYYHTNKPVGASTPVAPTATPPVAGTTVPAGLPEAGTSAALTSEPKTPLVLPLLSLKF